MSRLLRAMVVGIFVEHAAGVLGDGIEARDTTEVVVARAQEAAQIFTLPGTRPSRRLLRLSPRFPWPALEHLGVEITRKLGLHTLPTASSPDDPQRLGARLGAI